MTLDLNKKKIKGSGACSANPACFTNAFPQSGSGVVVAGVKDVTIKNGTIEDSFFHGVEIDNTLVENLTIRKDLVFAVNVFGSDDVVVRDTKMTNLAGNGLDVIVSDNFTLENNEIKKAGKARQVLNPQGEICGIGNGIFIFGSQGPQILNNKFDNISQSAILVWQTDDGLIDNNQASRSSFLPCGPPIAGSTDFGAITLVAGSNRTIVSRNTVRTTTVQAGIGLRGVQDSQIHHNILDRNALGIFFSNNPPNAAPAIHNNCIINSTSGVGLQTDGSGPYVINAENNFWDASDGPSGSGPLGGLLIGSGESINQKATDAVDVEPFLSKCRIKPAGGRGGGDDDDDNDDDD